jgi:tRNA-specific 2-thiouridylase
MAKIAVLMSGGVDSSCAALLLRRAGHEVMGLTAIMWREASRCCGEEDISRAARVCHKIGIRHHVIDMAEEFERRVVEHFARSYASGLTPNPCSVCNREIKFGSLTDAALRLGFEAVASGHYAALQLRGGVWVPAEPADRAKSQVYFLALVRKEILGSVMFPLAGMLKREVKEAVSSEGLPVRDGESQDLCFAGPRKYGEILKKYVAVPGEGDTVDAVGNRIGRHRGHVAYTVGQRLGAKGRRLYVIDKGAGSNEVTVGERRDAMAGSISARDVNFFSDSEPGPGAALMVKYRYNSPAVPARLVERTCGRISVDLEGEVFAPAPGQVLACYANGCLLCGGIIEKALA